MNTPRTPKPQTPSVAPDQYELLVESVEDYAIIMLDVNGIICSWNRGAAKIQGYEAHEIIGSHFSVFYLP